MKRVLVLNFFPAFTPPSSGGELRYVHMYRGLSARYDVTLLSPTYAHHKREVVEHSPSLREHRIPKEQVHDDLHQAILRESIGPEFSALVCALGAKVPNEYHRAYLELQSGADVIIHESPYMLEYDLLFGFDGRPRVYNSYNVESLLVDQIWSGAAADRYKAHIRSLEHRLVRDCALCFAVSEEERERFIRRYGADGSKILVAPNGIEPGEYGARRGGSSGRPARTALFIGSAHPPNLDAAEFIAGDVAAACPDIEFIIAGNCLEPGSRGGGRNVAVLGRVDEQRKRELFAEVDIALNPMTSGSGTNLKTLEYLSAGIPLVSTDIGARGLGLMPGLHYLAAERDGFAAALRRLAADPELRSRLAQAGKDHVDGRYAWSSIADSVGEAIEGLLERRLPSRRRRLLVLNDFEAGAPTSGGELRINRLYRALSRRYDIVLLCLNARGLVRITDIDVSFREISIPKTAGHVAAEAECDRGAACSTCDVTSAVQVSRNELFLALAKRLHAACDAVVLCHPYMVEALGSLEGKPVVYESLNYEIGLKSELLRGHPRYEEALAVVRRCETTAVEQSALIIAVSDEEHAHLRALTPREVAIHTVSNGTDVAPAPLPEGSLSRLKGYFGGRPAVLFIGSGHGPNVVALAYITGQLAQALPECVFLVVGSVCEAHRSSPPENVLLCGRVDGATKDCLLRLADVAINPVDTGAGSNLKLAEYFAARAPVVTTPFGARGYDVRDGVEAIVRDLPDFPGAIRRLVSDAALRSSLVEAAAVYARQELSWDGLARRYDAILRRSILPALQKRMLVVTYRFTEPPLGGGEMYLLEMLRRLSGLESFAVDVAALDIVEIANLHHFSSRYTHDPDLPAPASLPHVTVTRLKADVLPDDRKLENARTLSRLWMRESRELSLRHVDTYDAPMLMGGWHYPERSDDGPERWTSEEAYVCVKGVRALTIQCRCPKGTRVALVVDGVPGHAESCSGNAQLRLDLDGASVLALRVEDALLPPGDHRVLGVRVSSIRYSSDAGEGAIALDSDFRNFLKARFLDGYVDDLIQTAMRREAWADDLFQETRGPLSTSLQSWLEANIDDYDLVLGHSIPFSTSVLAHGYAKRHGKPFVILPHFHVEDEFYHWRSYYEALAGADEVITGPKAAEPLFFDKLGCKSGYLPFGINLDEAPAEEDEQRFGALYASELPYVLILGRKAGAKNYAQVIEAVKRVNADGRRCNVVFIGRDEDGAQLRPEEVLFLGPRPRGIVLAALKRALCLVSMSESESFGIVILESWAQRRPVIVNDQCTASIELVEDGANGLLADKNSLDAQIRRLLDDKVAADAMGAAGYDEVERRFTWRAISAALNERLLKIVERA